jgi:hypothetical protein
MKYNLLEDNKSILDLVNHVNSKIVDLRKSGKLDPEVAEYISKIYQDTVDVWMENNYLNNIEPTHRWENEIIDILIQLIGYLNLL